ncbi:MAG: OB-fold nucleic acid binding domain-containing protein [Candidatus Woesearchaeota archaeon]
MRDNTILRLAVTCCLLGLIILFVVSRSIKLETTPIEKISLMQEKEVQIEGVVQKVTDKGNLMILEVGYSTSMQVITFDKTKLERGDRIVVRGQLKEYNGRVEIEAEEIQVKR